MQTQVKAKPVAKPAEQTFGGGDAPPDTTIDESGEVADEDPVKRAVREAKAAYAAAATRSDEASLDRQIGDLRMQRPAYGSFCGC